MYANMELGFGFMPILIKTKHGQSIVEVYIINNKKENPQKLVASIAYHLTLEGLLYEVRSGLCTHPGQTNFACLLIACVITLDFFLNEGQ